MPDERVCGSCEGRGLGEIGVPDESPGLVRTDEFLDSFIALGRFPAKKYTERSIRQ